MNLGHKIAISFGGLLIMAIFISSLITRINKHSPPKDTGFKKGLIDSVWMELPRHDVKLLSPGVWGEAWLDTMYFMRIYEPGKQQYRTVEIYKSMYWKFKNSIGEYIQLESDSAQVVENQAEWDADSIKYRDAVLRMQKARNK